MLKLINFIRFRVILILLNCAKLRKKRYKGFTIQPNKYEKCRSKTVRMYQYTFTLYYTFRTIIKLNIFPIYTVSNYLLFSYINQIILLSIFINVNYVDCDYIIEMRIRMRISKKIENWNEKK